MTTPSDIAGLSERLRDAHPNSMQYINGSNILLDAATALDSLTARVKELEQVRDQLDERCATYERDCLRAEQQRDEAMQLLKRILDPWVGDPLEASLEEARDLVRRLASGPEGGSEGEK